MKKLVLLLTTLFTLAFACNAFAADGGDLNKEQKTADKIVASLNADAATAYAGFASSLSPELDKNMGAKGFAAIQKQVKEQLGAMKTLKFVNFRRFDDGDVVEYVGSFSKEKTVIVRFIFDKSLKLNTLSFIPVKEQAPAEKK